jgi:peptide/nickel transport system substrate-binding protein
MNNWAQLDNSPWVYWNYVYHLPILESQTTVNFERVNNAAAYKLVQQLDATKTTDLKGMKAVQSKLEKIFLQELPIIPMWYNGMWSSANTTYWKNWPSSTGLHYPPCLWRGYHQRGAIKMLTALKKA